MPRIFLCAGSLLAGLLPASVLALGLGEISPRSALNEPFVAEIPVIASPGDDVTLMTVALASRETFERYGLTRPAFMTDFAFRVVSDPAKPLVRITSTVPVVEPFVTVLLEVSWPQGRLLREYTVLLDPPVFESAAPVASPPPAAAPGGSGGQAVTRPQPLPAAPARATPQGRSAAPTAGSFGPVARNDTLWGIAQRMGPEAAGVDTNQMMLAIYRANPEAFAGNINQLRAGAILRMPSAEELNQLSTREAFAEVRRQTETWQASAGRLPAETPRLRLVPPPAEGAPAPAPPATTPTGSTAGAGRATDTAISELEAQLKNRERLLELKDQELAALQSQLAELRSQAGEEADLLEAPIDETPLTGVDAAQPGEPAAGEPETEPAAEAAADLEPEASAPEAPAASSLPPAVSTATTPAKEESSFLGGLFTNILFWAGLAVALLLGLFFARRRRGDEVTGRWDHLDGDQAIDDHDREATDRLRAPVTDPEETFVVEEGTAGATDALEAMRGGASATAAFDQSGDQELPLERTLSSEAGLNLDQSDPVAEAEFHMAYGLYDQAADLLINALRDEPERRDLRRKLLDVYFVWENKGGFLKEAQAFRDQVGDGDQDWNKVLIMGKQLCPEEELFAAQPQPAGADEAMDLELFEAGGGEVDMQLGEEDDSVDLNLSAIREVSEDDMLDFDLGESMADDIDLSPTTRDDGSDSPTQETPTIEAPGPGSSTLETPTIEQPMNEPTMETPTIEQPMNEPTMETPTLESPMADFAAREANTGETASLDLDELGLDLSEFEDLDETPDDAADDNIGDDAATMLASEMDDETLLRKIGRGLDSTAEVRALDAELVGDDDFDGLIDGDSTAEMLAVDEDGAGLEDLTQALEKRADSRAIGDTAEQPKPAVDDTAEQPRPDEAEGLGIDLDIGEELADESSPTGTLDMPERRPEGPTMTEVGTKLDLARAYIDMGDPEGARSILGEVIEEGDASQRQEAQKLIDDLAD